MAVAAADGALTAAVEGDLTVAVEEEVVDSAIVVAEGAGVVASATVVVVADLVEVVVRLPTVAASVTSRVRRRRFDAPRGSSRDHVGRSWMAYSSCRACSTAVGVEDRGHDMILLVG